MRLSHGHYPRILPGQSRFAETCVILSVLAGCGSGSFTSPVGDYEREARGEAVSGPQAETSGQRNMGRESFKESDAQSSVPPAVEPGSGAAESDSDTGAPGGPAVDSGTVSEAAGTGAWKHRVLVVDSGFDTAAPVFQGKLLSAQSIRCTAVDVPVGPPPASDDEIKMAYIRSFTQPGFDCSTQAEVRLQSSPAFNDIGGSREQWNEAVRRKDFSSFAADPDGADRILAVVSGRDQPGQEFVYHGTSTAGLIAYENDHVMLSLVDLKLDDVPFTGALRCPDPDRLAFQRGVLMDPDVREAYVNAPLSPFDRELQKIISATDPGMMNLSLGSSPYRVEAAMYRDLGCDFVEGDYLSQAAQLDEVISSLSNERMRRAGIDRSGILVFQSAGNDGAQINGAQDSTDCRRDVDRHLMVGSYNLANQRSPFSNFGSCVDVYAPGEQLVAPAPFGFLTIVDGTSFSSPLLLRAATQQFMTGISAAEMASALRAQAGGMRFAVQTAFPLELFFGDATMPVGGGFALASFTGWAASWVPLPNAVVVAARRASHPPLLLTPERRSAVSLRMLRRSALPAFGSRSGGNLPGL